MIIHSKIKPALQSRVRTVIRVLLPKVETKYASTMLNCTSQTSKCRKVKNLETKILVITRIGENQYAT